MTDAQDQAIIDQSNKPFYIEYDTNNKGITRVHADQAPPTRTVNTVCGLTIDIKTPMLDMIKLYGNPVREIKVKDSSSDTLLIDCVYHYNSWDMQDVHFDITIYDGVKEEIVAEYNMQKKPQMDQINKIMVKEACYYLYRYGKWKSASNSISAILDEL
jgi:hypothetical protein